MLQLSCQGCWGSAVAAAVLQTRLGPLLGPRCRPFLVAERVALPPDVPGCRPHHGAPATCTLAAEQQQQQQGREAGTGDHIGGLTTYVRHNAAVPGFTLLQLTALPPGPHPARGAPRPSLQVQLLNQQHAGPGVVQAIHQHTARHGPWVGTWAHFGTQYRHIAAAAGTLGPSATGAPRKVVALNPQPRAEGPSGPEDPSPAPASTVAAAAAAAAPKPCPATDLRYSLCSLRKPRPGRYGSNEISVSAKLARALAGRHMDTPGEKVPVPIYVPGSEPKSFLPDSCYVRTYLRRNPIKDSLQRRISGLGPFFCNNRPDKGSRLLLLAVVPPDPARGYPTPSLAVQLIDRDVGSQVLAAMQEYLKSTPDAWYGRHPDLVPFFAAVALRLSLLGKTGVASGAGPKALPAPLDGFRRRSPRVGKGPRVLGDQTVQQRLSMLPEGLDQVHVEAVRCFLEAAVDRKVAKLVQPSAFKNDLFYVRNAFAAALGAKWQEDVKPDRVDLPVLQCYPRGTSRPLTKTYLRGSWIGRQGFTVWRASGFKPWLVEVGADTDDLLLLWGVEAGPEAGVVGKQGSGDGGGERGRLGMGLRAHLIRRKEVGIEELEALVGLVSVW